MNCTRDLYQLISTVQDYIVIEDNYMNLELYTILEVLHTQYKMILRNLISCHFVITGKASNWN